jgi:YesN/AraC family two-component response regulator
MLHLYLIQIALIFLPIENDEFHYSFADFINKYRIGYAKQILQQKEHTPKYI